MNIHEIGIADKGQAKGGTRESAIPQMPAPSLFTLARIALDDAAGNVETATALLADQLHDPAIRKSLAQDAVKQQAQSVIGSVRAYERQAIERRIGASKVLARAAAVDRSFMAWPLPFGGVLGDATAADIRRAIEHYESTSAAMLRRAAFLSKVLSALPDGATVRAALTEEQLATWGATQ